MTQMTTLIPLEYYYSEEFFQKEQKILFEQTWQFAGFTMSVSELDAMFCTQIAGKSVVIKNFNGQLRAFHNVCSHRFSPICGGVAKGPLQCPYHGWTYDETGLPYAIPGRKKFTNLNPEALRLQSYAVETCGKFIFVRISKLGPSLSEYLGDAVQLLEQASAALGQEIDRNEMLIEANWKLIVENSIEDYHVRNVHSESLYAVGIKGSKANLNEGIHTSLNIHFETQLDSNKKLAELYARRPWHQDHFLHQFIFPNLAVATTFGATISVQYVTPLSANKTHFVSYVFGTLLEDNVGHFLVKVFNDNAVNFNRQVFSEDKVICEGVQKMLKEADFSQGPLCENEQRIWAFHKAYMQEISK